jgi:hypothetical protein
MRFNRSGQTHAGIWPFLPAGWLADQETVTMYPSVLPRLIDGAQ